MLARGQAAGKVPPPALALLLSRFCNRALAARLVQMGELGWGSEGLWLSLGAPSQPCEPHTTSTGANCSP